MVAILIVFKIRKLWLTYKVHNQTFQKSWDSPIVNKWANACLWKMVHVSNYIIKKWINP